MSDDQDWQRRLYKLSIILVIAWNIFVLFDSIYLLTYLKLEGSELLASFMIINIFFCITWAVIGLIVLKGDCPVENTACFHKTFIALLVLDLLFIILFVAVCVSEKTFYINYLVLIMCRIFLDIRYIRAHLHLQQGEVPYTSGGV